jgi:hypothetical protein
MTNIVYLWGYMGKHPVAEIKNATYAEVQAALSFPPENTSTYTTVHPAVEALRSNLSLAHAHITTLTYSPFGGIATATDPNGINTAFEYFNTTGHLKNIKNHESKIMEEYTYSYAPHAVTFGTASSFTVSVSGLNRLYVNMTGYYTAQTAGGSGDYNYSWYFKDAEGNILTHNSGSSNQFSVSTDVTGQYTVVCSVRDLLTGAIREVVKNFEVASENAILPPTFPPIP